MFISVYLISRFVDVILRKCCNFVFNNLCSINLCEVNFNFVSFNFREKIKQTSLTVHSYFFICVRTSNIDYNIVKENIAKIHKYKIFYLQSLEHHLY